MYAVTSCVTIGRESVTPALVASFMICLMGSTAPCAMYADINRVYVYQDGFTPAVITLSYSSRAPAGECVYVCVRACVCVHVCVHA